MPVYCVDKPLGLSSHAVVSRARKLLQTKRVGHAGTLDPLASGVLVLLAESSTKLSPFLSASSKSYLAWIAFGGSSPTLDAEGPLINPVKPVRLQAEDIRAALGYFRSMEMQLPPSFSAIKQGGVKGYEAARRGEALDLAKRPVCYEHIELIAFAPSRKDLESSGAYHNAQFQDLMAEHSVTLPEELAPLPTALIYVKVSAGTYIRAMARDLGEHIGYPAYLSGLVRTQAGAFSLAQSVPLEALASASYQENAQALPYPLFKLSQEESQRVQQGQRLRPSFEGRAGLLDPQGRLIAVAENIAGRMKLLRVFRQDT